MSHHGSTRRDRSSRREESHERIELSRRHSAGRAEIHVDIEPSPDIQTPPRIYVRAPSDPAYPQPPPLFQSAETTYERVNRHPSRNDYKRSQQRSRSYANIEREHSHEYAFHAEHDDGGRMPTIQQNYRPSHSRPELYTTFTQMPDVHNISTHPEPLRTSHQRRQRVSHRHDSSKILHGGGGGHGGDIQTSAVEDAEPDADTLNKIMICVFRNSKRQFVQKEVWMMKPGHRDDIFLDPPELLRKDPAFHKVLRTDTAFFKEINWRYKNQLRGTFRRYLSFKTVSTVRVLGVCSNPYLGTVGGLTVITVWKQHVRPRRHQRESLLTSLHASLQ